MLYRNCFAIVFALAMSVPLSAQLSRDARFEILRTVIADQAAAKIDMPFGSDGIDLSDAGEVAHVIFLLAISKSDYEEAMAIYELFVTFVRERSMSRLLGSDSFDSFKAVALDCLSRS